MPCGTWLRLAIPGTRADHTSISRFSTFPAGLSGEGVPYLLDRYQLKSPDGTWTTRSRELPLKDMLIDFGQTAR